MSRSMLSQAIAIFYILSLSTFCLHPHALSISFETECPVFYKGVKKCDPIAQQSFLPAGVVSTTTNTSEASKPTINVLEEILNALDVMQSEYFTLWLGTWPDAIDWTAAVMATEVSGALRSLSKALPYIDTGLGSSEDWKAKENLIDKYFSQLVGYYFEMDAFAIRNEAYDDMLWVVLGWLETIKFIDLYAELHYSDNSLQQGEGSMAAVATDVGAIFQNQTWHGKQWVPAFSHRSRIFWDLASKGWDTTLCGGGMIWNPILLPYKNAVTNELYIAASISTYLYSPGDAIDSPFMNSPYPDAGVITPPRDPKFLKAAVEGYKWLASANMTNTQGLYVDGFHISGLDTPGNNNTKCDQRSEAVFTYNQGILLTGQRGLWEATGASSFLSDGHTLVQNAIKATGWDLINDEPVDDLTTLQPGELAPWHGLGRAGVMEDTCDASGTCSQDGQTFKGIFFHHLAEFCAPLEATAPDANTTVDERAFAATKKSHAEACKMYVCWLRHNSEAALNTRDENGKFGMWWTAGLITNWAGPWPTLETDGVPEVNGSVDVWNYGIPDSWRWPEDRGEETDKEENAKKDGEKKASSPSSTPDDGQKPMHGRARYAPRGDLGKMDVASGDPNARGRGRTVETQGGGLALLRAWWDLAQVA